MTQQKISALKLDPDMKFMLIQLAQDHAELFTRLTSQILTAAGIVIFGASSALAKTGAAITNYIVSGVPRQIPASTALPALSGTTATTLFNVYAWFVDGSGNLTSAMGTASATLAGVIFPVAPVGSACVGFVQIHPTGTGAFVGGTTNLDDVTVVPNAVFISPTGPFNPGAVAQIIA